MGTGERGCADVCRRHGHKRMSGNGRGKVKREKGERARTRGCVTVWVLDGVEAGARDRNGLGEMPCGHEQAWARGAR